MFALRKALVDLRALTVLTKAKFEEAEAKFVAENPGKWSSVKLKLKFPWMLPFVRFFPIFFQRPMALVDLDPDSWQGDYTSAERLHRHLQWDWNYMKACLLRSILAEVGDRGRLARSSIAYSQATDCIRQLVAQLGGEVKVTLRVLLTLRWIRWENFARVLLQVPLGLLATSWTGEEICWTPCRGKKGA